MAKLSKVEYDMLSFLGVLIWIWFFIFIIVGDLFLAVKWLFCHGKRNCLNTQCTMEDSFYSYINIFHQMVCKYHSSLEQECYFYEQDDVLISLKVGDKAWRWVIRGICEIYSEDFYVYGSWVYLKKGVDILWREL